MYLCMYVCMHTKALKMYWPDFKISFSMIWHLNTDFERTFQHSLRVQTHMYIYIYICVCVCVYVYACLFKIIIWILQPNFLFFFFVFYIHFIFYYLFYSSMLIFPFLFISISYLFNVFFVSFYVSLILLLLKHS